MEKERVPTTLQHLSASMLKEFLAPARRQIAAAGLGWGCPGQGRLCEAGVDDHAARHLVQQPHGPRLPQAVRKGRLPLHLRTRKLYPSGVCWKASLKIVYIDKIKVHAARMAAC